MENCTEWQDDKADLQIIPAHEQKKKLSMTWAGGWLLGVVYQ